APEADVDLNGASRRVDKRTLHGGVVERAELEDLGGLAAGDRRRRRLALSQTSLPIGALGKLLDLLLEAGEEPSPIQPDRGLLGQEERKRIVDANPSGRCHGAQELRQVLVLGVPFRSVYPLEAFVES